MCIYIHTHRVIHLMYTHCYGLLPMIGYHYGCWLLVLKVYALVPVESDAKGCMRMGLSLHVYHII